MVNNTKIQLHKSSLSTTYDNDYNQIIESLTNTCIVLGNELIILDHVLLGEKIKYYTSNSSGSLSHVLPNWNISLGEN